MLLPGKWELLGGRHGAVACDTTTVDGGAARLFDLAHEPRDGRNDDAGGRCQLHDRERFEHAFICVQLENGNRFPDRRVQVATTRGACC